MSKHDIGSADYWRDAHYKIETQLRTKATLRDQFDMAALTGLAAHGGYANFQDMAADAHDLGAAMMKARKQSDE